MLIYYKVDDILFKVKLEFECGMSTVCKKKNISTAKWIF